jgi:thiol-disulfide isomerase/thioredoxin
MKQLLILLTLVFIISGCNGKKSLSIDGIIKGETENYIYITRIDVDTPVMIDSAKINKRGAFRFRIEPDEADFYQVGYSTTNFITLLAEPGEKISLIFKGTTLFENYSVTGSVGSEKVQILDLNLNNTKRRLDSLDSLYSIASGEPGFDVKGPLLEEEFIKLIKEQRLKNIEFIINNTTSLASIKALYQRINPQTYVLYDPKDLQYLKIVNDSLTRYYPNSKHVQALSRDFEKEMNQMYSRQLAQMTKDIPETKLDPDLKDVTGRRIKLSSLSGKYKLVTFWSVKSKECVEENLQLKELYKLYNKKGFEIYQINLDENEAEWKRGVKFDELPWISTREDNPLDPKNAILFNVKKLPANFLFGKDGKIIGTDLHGRSLKLRLEQLFN